MSFSPVLVGGGLAGWQALQVSLPRQEAAFAASPAEARAAERFTARIGEIRTAADLMADRQVLAVALSAFGLSEDIGNTAFIERVLEGGASDPRSLANRLSDGRYAELAGAFGFDIGGLPMERSGFAEGIVSAAQRERFEAAVGESDPTMRLALSIDREVGEIAGLDLSENGKWFTVMGTPPVRAVFEAVFALPTSIGTLDVDRQLGVFKERAEAVFGSSDLAQFSEPGALEDLTRRYLVSSQLAGQAGPASGASIALQLLGGI